MAVSPEVMELVDLLNDEGFGALAGELLTWLSTRQLGVDDEATGDATNLPDLASMDEAGFVLDTRTPAGEMAAAVSFLRLHLVYPIRRLAEAEKIAGSLSHEDPVGAEAIFDEDADAIEIQFLRSGEDQRPRLERAELRGSDELATKLGAVLSRLVAEL